MVGFSQNELPMVTKENNLNRIETVSAMTERSFQRNLENYAKKKLFQYIMEIKGSKQTLIMIKRKLMR